MLQHSGLCLVLQHVYVMCMSKHVVQSETFVLCVCMCLCDFLRKRERAQERDRDRICDMLISCLLYLKDARCVDMSCVCVYLRVCMCMCVHIQFQKGRERDTHTCMM